MCEFRLEELELYNFRKFEEKTYKLNPQMNVFAGKNGSGNLRNAWGLSGSI